MFILHAALDRGVLLIWAEASEPARARRKQDPPVSPFDPGERTLLALAHEIGIAEKTATRRVVAWLPSAGDAPVPAGVIVENAAIRPWTVRAVEVNPANTADLFAAAIGKRLLRPGLLIGNDLAFWAAALRFAAGLVMRGRFLPGLVAEGDHGVARWQPVVAGVDAERLRDLAAAMPPAARAVGIHPGGGPPQTAALTVLREFLDSAVDGLVRSPGSHPVAAESLHDRWMHALAYGDGVIRAPAPELHALIAQVRQWQRPVQVASKAPYRLCFRLEEPEDGDASWLLRYLLQGNRDPSLLLPASQAWKDASIREHLLASLGQAAGIYPPVEESLRERAPEGCALDTTRAHAFLTDIAAALEQARFGVMLPGWWTRRSQSRLTLRAQVKSPAMKGGSGISLETIVAFNWKVALGDDVISAAELEALARLKTPLVKLRGQWVEVNTEQIRAAIEFLKKRSAGKTTMREVVRMSVGMPEALPLEVSAVTGSGWISGVLKQLDGTVAFEEQSPPAELRAELRPYQVRGYSWLEFMRRFGLGACLADDMGLGKTVQALALVQGTRMENGGRPVLIVCPTSVIGNWQKEAARFAPELSVLVHHGSKRGKGEEFAREAERHAIVLSSYTLLHRDTDALAGVEWGGVILDEAQNIKNAETRQARAARRLPAGWRIALTGTPVENNVGDLWSVMEFLNPGFLGSRASFRTRFFVPIQIYGNQDAAQRLRRATGPFILRRLKTDKSIISDLPDKLEMKVFCTLTREQASLYEAVVRDTEAALASSEGIERKGLVLATLSKLKQVCNHPAQFLKDNSGLEGRSGKLARLTEMIEETLEVGDRSLIFTQFAEMGDLILRHLRESLGAEVLFLHGGTTRRQRDRMVESFAMEDGPAVFLLSLKAGGTGLNLTRANHVFHFDRWWNPAVENQATDRAFRIGQKRNVQVHKFLCSGTLEEKIDEMIEKKKDVAGRVVGTGEAWLTELSNTELKNLFALRKDAVGE